MVNSMCTTWRKLSDFINLHTVRGIKKLPSMGVDTDTGMDMDTGVIIRTGVNTGVATGVVKIRCRCESS